MKYLKEKVKKKKKNPIQSSKEKAPKNESSSVSASLFI